MTWKQMVFGLILAPSLLLTGCGFARMVQIGDASEDAARALSAMQFDPEASVTVNGLASAVFLPVAGVDGMIVVRSGAAKYVFTTAETRAMAQQGFRRTSIGAGQEVVVTGVLAAGGAKLNEMIAARADTIVTADGRKLFDRALLPEEPKDTRRGS